MKILLTGGHGFIARNLQEQLSSEHTIASYNSQMLNLLDANRVRECIAQGKFDVVIHCATYDAAPRHSTKDPSKVLEYNLRMFFSLARCHNSFGKMIYFGSGAEFDRAHWMPRMREDYFDQHVPADQYGLSKYIMTKHAQTSSNIYNLRLFGVFGKYDDWRTRFIPSACCHAIHNVSVRINQNVFFDNLYVDDLARIVEWFISNTPRRHVYNVCSGSVYEFKALAHKIIHISQKDIGVDVRNQGLGQEYSGDNSLLVDELGGFEFSHIDESIKALYDWHYLNRHMIERDSL